MEKKYVLGGLLTGTIIGIVAGIAGGLLAGVTMKHAYDSYLQYRPMRRKLKSIYKKAFKKSHKCLIM
jgi:hypothetical protein